MGPMEEVSWMINRNLRIIQNIRLRSHTHFSPDSSVPQSHIYTAQHLQRPGIRHRKDVIWRNQESINTIVADLLYFLNSWWCTMYMHTETSKKQKASSRPKFHWSFGSRKRKKKHLESCLVKTKSKSLWLNLYEGLWGFGDVHTSSTVINGHPVCN